MNRNVKISVYLIVGVVILIILSQFVISEKNKSTINLSPLEIGKDSVSSESMMIKILENEDFYLDDNLVKFENLESEILTKRDNDSIKTIVIKAEESVQVSNIIKVMEIANENEFKVIFSVKP